MNTVATAVSGGEKRINFLDFNKKIIDFRFKFHERNFMQSITGVIYWIGIIDLKEVTEKDQYTNMLFIDQVGDKAQLRVDGYYDRHEDGVTMGKTIKYQYGINDPKLRQEIFTAKNLGKNHFIVLLEETVNGYGEHDVSLLFDDNGYSTVRGVAINRSILDLPLRECLWMCNQRITGKTQRIQLLGNDRYHWMK